MALDTELNVGATVWEQNGSSYNPDRDWKYQLPVISDTELKAAVDAQPDPRDTVDTESVARRAGGQRADYLADT